MKKTGIFSALAGGAATILLLLWVGVNVGSQNASAGRTADIDITGRYNMFMTNAAASALDGILTMEKVYWLDDADITAPEPDASKFGSAPASELGWLLEDAAGILDGQKTLFNTDIQTFYGSNVDYYLDDTILAVTWKQVIDSACYTISEVKIAHPSQFRRFLAGGEFGSDMQYLTSEMAESVNAVVASSGDFYKFRSYGIVVFGGKICRLDGDSVDTCFIDGNGDLLFARRHEITDMETADAFVDEHDVRFSLVFGPVLVEDGKACPPSSYPLGEVNDPYARAALAQTGKLHYLLITVNGEGGFNSVPTIPALANSLERLGVDRAYALDGGQTAAIIMNDRLINRVVFGYQRRISDIIYFATAIPGGEAQP